VQVWTFLIVLSCLALSSHARTRHTEKLQSNSKTKLDLPVLHHPHATAELEWMMREIRLKDETNSGLSSFPCFAIAKSASWFIGGGLFVFGGLFAGLPLGFFIPLVPYFSVPNWVQADCTSIEPAFYTKSCGKSGCRYAGQVMVSFSTASGDPIETYMYSGVSNIADLSYSDAVVWVANHQPYNITTCFYNPNNPNQLTLDRTVPWYLYLYAVFIAPFVLIGLSLVLTGLLAILRHFGLLLHIFHDSDHPKPVLTAVDAHIAESAYTPPPGVAISVATSEFGTGELSVSVDNQALDSTYEKNDSSSSSSS